MGIYSHWIDTLVVIEGFKFAFGVPGDVFVRRADPVDHVRRSYADGWMRFSLITVVERGVRFPLHPLLRACLCSWNLTPYQLVPNSFKIIMGTVALNQHLHIDLGVHDIEDVYDICKTKEGAYYLRVKPKRRAFITAMEDSNKYAGDDLISVSGNWEFGPEEEDRAYSIPRQLGAVPTAQQRKAELVGWVRNDSLHQRAAKCTDFSNRAAWALLGYQPRYRGYYKRSEAGLERTDVEVMPEPQRREPEPVSET